MSAGAAVTSLNLDSNDLFGDRRNPDKFAAQCEPFFVALKESQIAVLSLKGTGMGPTACGMLATSLSAALIEAVPDALASAQELRLGGRQGDAEAQLLACSLAACGSLTVLDLSDSNLTRVPAEVCDIVALRSLDLRSNDIAELPVQLTQLKSLTTLELEGNPQLAALAQIVEQRGCRGCSSTSSI
jgi:hypothetical protein